MADRDASGRFKRVPAARRTAAYNARLRRNIAKRGPTRFRPTRAELRGHAPTPPTPTTAGPEWSRPMSGPRAGELINVFGEFDINFPDGRTDVRTPVMQINTTRLELRRNWQEWAQDAQDALAREGRNYADPFDVGRFRGVVITRPYSPRRKKR